MEQSSQPEKFYDLDIIFGFGRINFFVKKRGAPKSKLSKNLNSEDIYFIKFLNGRCKNLPDSVRDMACMVVNITNVKMEKTQGAFSNRYAEYEITSFKKIMECMERYRKYPLGYSYMLLNSKDVIY